MQKNSRKNQGKNQGKNQKLKKTRLNTTDKVSIDDYSAIKTKTKT
jgi:hypothetical protein